eukprot:850498_1
MANNSKVNEDFNDDEILSILTDLSWDNSEFPRYISMLISAPNNGHATSIEKCLSIIYSALKIYDSLHDTRIQKIFGKLLDVFHKNIEFESETVHSFKFLLRCVRSIPHISVWMFLNPSAWVVKLLVA